MAALSRCIALVTAKPSWNWLSWERVALFKLSILNGVGRNESAQLIEFLSVAENTPASGPADPQFQVTLTRFKRITN
jgi:hypothetical protein